MDRALHHAANIAARHPWIVIAACLLFGAAYQWSVIL